MVCPASLSNKFCSPLPPTTKLRALIRSNKNKHYLCHLCSHRFTSLEYNRRKDETGYRICEKCYQVIRKKKKCKVISSSCTCSIYFFLQCSLLCVLYIIANESSSSLLQQLSALPPSVSKQQYSIIRDFHRLSDYHNNYGCDFIPSSYLSYEYKQCMMLLINGPIMSLQSGPGTDDRAYANILWDDCISTCSRLFSSLHLLIATSHASDLLQYILVAHDLQQKESLNGPTQIVSFPWHYYSQGFVAHTSSLTNSVTFHFHCIESDPTDIKQEKAALKQLKQAFMKQRSICLIEPILIPGKGKLIPHHHYVCVIAHHLLCLYYAS